MKSGERGYLVTALVTATLLGAIAGCGGHVEGEGVGSAPSADTGQRPTVTELGGCAYAVVITSDARDVELGALVGSPQCPAQVRLTIAAGVRVGASSPKRAALTIGGLARGSSVTIENNGKIVGAGGAGGDGGNGGSGGDPVSCGRPGAPGGTALQVELPTTLVTVGEILGGGGGGGGASGGNLAIGGGGGAGGGAGGRPATTLSERDELAYCGQDNGYREGTAGAPGTIDHPGLARRDEQHRCRAGQGGEPGMPGEPSDCYGAAEGGAGGSAIAIAGDATVNVPNGPYDTGAGAIRGAVGPR